MLATQLDLTVANSAAGPVLVASATRQETWRDTPPHRHARGQIFGSSRGLLTVSTELGQWVVPATHAVWIPPHHLHGLQTFGPFAGWSGYVLETACGDLSQMPFTFRMSGLLREAILRAADWDGDELSDAQARIAAVVLDEIRRSPHEPLGLPMPADERLRRIARALVSDPSDPRGLTAWADLAGIAPRSAARHFLAETGFTFTEWRQRARLLKALQMLSAGNAVSRVALELGYDNVSAFIAMFRKVMGVTPGSFAAASRAGTPGPGLASAD